MQRAETCVSARFVEAFLRTHLLMKSIGLIAALFGLSFVAGRGAEMPPNPLAGHWRIDLTRSTELSPWKSFDLTIAIDGNMVRIQRDLAWGRRTNTDVTAIDVTNRENIVRVDWWPDNRHLGAYIGDDKTKRVRAEWVDAHRILRLSSDLVLETQQGARAVNVLSDYKVSASGSELTLTELRSTRNRPIVYVFKRVSS
jgi:hypothetical protein